MKCARISLVTRTHAGQVPFAMRPGAPSARSRSPPLRSRRARGAGSRTRATRAPPRAANSCEFSAPCLPGATCTQSFDIGDGVDKTSGLPFNYSTASGSVTGGSLGGRSYCGPAGCDDNALALTFQSADLSVKWVSASCESRETPEQCRLATKTPIPASPPLTKVTAQQTCLNKVTPCTYYKAEATVDFRAAWRGRARRRRRRRRAAAAAAAGQGHRRRPRPRSGTRRGPGFRAAGEARVPRGACARGGLFAAREGDGSCSNCRAGRAVDAAWHGGPRQPGAGRARRRRGEPGARRRWRAQRAGRHGRLGVHRAGGRRVTRTRCCNARERNNRTRATPERERRRFSRAVTKPTPASSHVWMTLAIPKLRMTCLVVRHGVSPLTRHARAARLTTWLHRFERSPSPWRPLGASTAARQRRGRRSSHAVGEPPASRVSPRSLPEPSRRVHAVPRASARFAPPRETKTRPTRRPTAFPTSPLCSPPGGRGGSTRTCISGYSCSSSGSSTRGTRGTGRE